MVWLCLKANNMPRFTVDTHLFSELGALLVGRDSTALNELVKNAYDADAKTVIVHGQGLDTPSGSIRVIDDGIGMTAEAFERGFLRIASRAKREGERRSALFERKYTGRKGIGRLAAHKLASQIRVLSTPDPRAYENQEVGVWASIDWDIIEKLESLDESHQGIRIRTISPGLRTNGTTIELRRLRRPWSDSMLAAFVGEVQSFEAPDLLINVIPDTVLAKPLLFEKPLVRDSTAADPGFQVYLSGEFDRGEDFWHQLAERFQWVIEIQAVPGDRCVKYGIGPTISELSRTPSARTEYWTYPHPDPEVGPFFSARIFVRATRRVPRNLQDFARGSAGIRLFMEGFRVLPYGERRDDWLGIDADYTHRREAFELSGFQGEALDGSTERETFFRLANSSYYGGVFLTDAGSTMLNMLVNREGFIPDKGFEDLRKLLRRGVDLSVRLRASVQAQSESADRRVLADDIGRQRNVVQMLGKARATLESAKARSEKLHGVDEELNSGFIQVSDSIQVAEKALADVQVEQRNLRVAASVGTQLAAFVHEINSLLGQARTVNAIAERLAKLDAIPNMARRTVNDIRTATEILVHQLERQVSFLTDVVGASARRRRQRLRVRDQIDIALKLLMPSAERRNQAIEIEVTPDLRTPPMFSGELLSILINVLSNAIKAAGNGGTIRITGKSEDKSFILQTSNTGQMVDLSEAERWFRPFESTTTEIDEVLGQGMGLGLPVVRRLLDEYGGAAEFSEPEPSFSTTLIIRVPETR